MPAPALILGLLAAVAVAVERIRGLYADRIERLERRHAVLAGSGSEQADDARTRGDARRLLEALTDLEQAELQTLQNESVVDSRLARRLQQSLDLQPLGDATGDASHP